VLEIAHVRLLGRSRTLIAGVLQATSLTFTVTAAQIGPPLGVVTQATAAEASTSSRSMQRIVRDLMRAPGSPRRRVGGDRMAFRFASGS
jgi:hypothetical protein